MYADKVTPSMERAIDETSRRRAKQLAYNSAMGIDPQPLRKRIADITDLLAREDADTAELVQESASARRRPKAETELVDLIDELTAQMHQAAAELQFELAARLRDEVSDLKRELRGMREATA